VCDHCHCRDIPAISELTAEHEAIQALAWRVAESGRDGAPVDTVARDELLRLVELHQGKEEAGLFPLLLDQGDLDPETAAGLVDEHRTLHAVLTDGDFDRRDYYALMAHIEVEESELFPAAMFAFDDDTWDLLETTHRNLERTT
jgi:hemerythrin-like domain-containing protein